MPIYSYTCKGCNEQRDYLLGVGKVPERCSGCGSESLVKVITAPSLKTADKAAGTFTPAPREWGTGYLDD